MNEKLLRLIEDQWSEVSIELLAWVRHLQMDHDLCAILQDEDCMVVRFNRRVLGHE